MPIWSSLDEGSDAVDGFVGVVMGFEVVGFVPTGVVSIDEKLSGAMGLIAKDSIDRRIVVLEGVEDALDPSLAFVPFGRRATGSSVWRFEELSNIGRWIA
jgi:hypothetical protein